MREHGRSQATCFDPRSVLCKGLLVLLPPISTLPGFTKTLGLPICSQYRRIAHSLKNCSHDCRNSFQLQSEVVDVRQHFPAKPVESESTSPAAIIEVKKGIHTRRTKEQYSST